MSDVVMLYVLIWIILNVLQELAKAAYCFDLLTIPSQVCINRLHFLTRDHRWGLQWSCTVVLQQLRQCHFRNTLL